MVNDMLKQQKQAEIEHFNQVLEDNKKQALDDMFKKKKDMKNYIDNLLGQVDDYNKRKQIETAKEKQFCDTGLKVGNKKSKCYNCARCLQKYPLKALNKKKKKKRA